MRAVQSSVSARGLRHDYPPPPRPAATVREKEWDNIAAVHRGLAQVTTWSYDRQRMGEHRLLPARLEGAAGRRAAATVGSPRTHSTAELHWDAVICGVHCAVTGNEI